MNKLKSGTASFMLLFIVLTGVIAVYNECEGSAHHFDRTAEHHDPLIHCPDALLVSHVQASSINQSQRRIVEAVATLQQGLEDAASVLSFEHYSIRKPPLFRQYLFRFLEVYRL